jgi:glycosyltransferase involved in cell wall biosynthesis
MKFAVITHVPHIPFENTFQGYSAYVREMNLWANKVDELLLVAPISKDQPTAIHLPYKHKSIRFFKIPSMAFISIGSSVKTLCSLPIIFYKIVKAMKAADHIHLRCPGTIGLMGCFVQLLFPGKPKTAKYAGNWDPTAKQPLSYRLQKRILSNTSITKNMNVLVYGDWKGQTKNIVPFFTATYPAKKARGIVDRTFNEPLRAMFVGALAPGKRPLYAIQLIAGLQKIGVDITLDIYGEGVERNAIERSIEEQALENYVTLHGNQTSQVIEDAYKESHFMILPSKSEGWPKVVAESMFWGCIPIATSVSCVPWMLDQSTRGIIATLKLEDDIATIKKIINEDILKDMSRAAQGWSQQYTIDDFEEAIQQFLK